jgi:Derlin-2/3
VVILARFGAILERDPLRTSRVGGSADFLFSLLIMGITFLCFASLLGYPFIAPLMNYSILYLWSKKYPEAPTNIWGFSLKGSQLPWAVLLFNLITGASVMPYIIGILVGHIYYFLVTVLPLKNNKHYLQTPEWLISVVNKYIAEENTTPSGRPQRRNATGHNWGGAGRRLND